MTNSKKNIFKFNVKRLYQQQVRAISPVNVVHHIRSLYHKQT